MILYRNCASGWDSHLSMEADVSTIEIKGPFDASLFLFEQMISLSSQSYSINPLLVRASATQEYAYQPR